MLAIQTDFLRLTHDETCIVLVWAVGIILINLLSYYVLKRNKKLSTYQKKDKMTTYSLCAMLWPILLASAVTLVGIFIVPYLLAVLPANLLFRNKG